MRLSKREYNNIELAKILRVSKRTIGDYLKKGILTRKGKLFSRSEITQLLGLKIYLQEFKLLRVEEVVKMLGKSATSVYRYHEERRLHCVKLGGTLIFFQKDVEDFLRSRKQSLKKENLENL